LAVAEWKPFVLGAFGRAKPLHGVSVVVINTQFRDSAGTSKDYRAAVKAAVGHGWIVLHPSGAYMMFTQAGADLFALSNRDRR
jgi:hypothetical protein